MPLPGECISARNRQASQWNISDNLGRGRQSITLLEWPLVSGVMLLWDKL